MSCQLPLVSSTSTELDPPSPQTPAHPHPPTDPQTPRLQPGDQIHRYRLDTWIRDGGVASVYWVRHQTLETLHTLKKLHHLRSDLLEWLVIEDRLQARLIHPHIIRVQDVLEVRGRRPS